MPAAAVGTFVGAGGCSISRLRTLCGDDCELELSNTVVGQDAEVLLLALDEARLARAVSLVQKWIHCQQVRGLGGSLIGSAPREGVCMCIFFKLNSTSLRNPAP